MTGGFWASVLILQIKWQVLRGCPGSLCSVILPSFSFMRKQLAKGFSRNTQKLREFTVIQEGMTGTQPRALGGSKNRSTLGLCNLHYRSIGVQNCSDPPWALGAGRRVLLGVQQPWPEVWYILRESKLRLPTWTSGYAIFEDSGPIAIPVDRGFWNQCSHISISIYIYMHVYGRVWVLFESWGGGSSRPCPVCEVPSPWSMPCVGWAQHSPMFMGSPTTLLPCTDCPALGSPLIDPSQPEISLTKGEPLGG